MIGVSALINAAARSRGVRGEALIPMASLSEPGDFTDCAFTHLWSTSKTSALWAARVEEHFKRDFPNQYAAACAGFALLEKAGLTK